MAYLFLRQRFARMQLRQHYISSNLYNPGNTSPSVNNIGRANFPLQSGSVSAPLYHSHHSKIQCIRRSCSRAAMRLMHTPNSLQRPKTTGTYVAPSAIWYRAFLRALRPIVMLAPSRMYSWKGLTTSMSINSWACYLAPHLLIESEYAWVQNFALIQSNTSPTIEYSDAHLLTIVTMTKS
jgi:hypothetical protein